MVQMPSGYMIDASMVLGIDFVEFLDTCMRASDDLEALVNVGVEGGKKLACANTTRIGS